MTYTTPPASESGELLPCPFCGSANIDPAQWSGNDGKFGPGCGDCGALAETAADWNRRAALANQPAPTVPATPVEYIAWWTSIETDLRKSLLIGAGRDRERLHDLLRTAYEAGQAAHQPAQEQASPAHETIVSEAGALVCTACGTTAQAPVAAAPDALDDDELARLRRVVRLLGMDSEVPQDDATLCGCLFSVLGMIARKLEQAHAGADEAKTMAHGHRDDFYLLANGRRLGLEPISRVRHMPNWVLAMELFATGSTSANQICRGAGVDPDSCTIERAAIQAAQEEKA